jgi:methylmalonyl-CoA/ethylmalonyl-CoA epimerase
MCGQMTELAPDLRLHHVGFVVTDIAACVEGFALSLQAKWSGEVFADPLQRVKVTFLTVSSDQALVELVEPLGEDSPVQRFLQERSGGLHHLCYEVSDAEAQLKRIRACRGLIVSRPKPAIAFGGRRVAWALTQQRLLLEFLEKGEGT